MMTRPSASGSGRPCTSLRRGRGFSREGGSNDSPGVLSSTEWGHGLLHGHDKWPVRDDSGPKAEEGRSARGRQARGDGKSRRLRGQDDRLVVELGQLCPSEPWGGGCGRQLG